LLPQLSGLVGGGGEGGEMSAFVDAAEFGLALPDERVGIY